MKREIAAICAAFLADALAAPRAAELAAAPAARDATTIIYYCEPTSCIHKGLSSIGVFMCLDSTIYGVSSAIIECFLIFCAYRLCVLCIVGGCISSSIMCFTR